MAQEIMRIPTYKGAEAIEIFRFVVMPDHVHILLQIHDRLPKHLGQYVRWFKIQCSDAVRELAETAARTKQEAETTPTVAGQVLGANTPTATGQVLGAISPSKKIGPFAPEYHDRILTGKGQLAHMVRYIEDNPRRLALKRAPDRIALMSGTSSRVASILRLVPKGSYYSLSRLRKPWNFLKL